ncbi:hypothetical protein BJ875DRAFT_487362 [Amylocarpus encephaloides]|uniref:Apple domain-containing protein n=1 Tax=Amylocarpus encephaloides TaxID=45428 RepID=A0A9P7YBY0_9HELO|nr:hypothetical protein BJ875DRAFT_487362 [Amylocarpus encephaloides]
MELQFLTALTLCVGLATAIPHNARTMITAAPQQELPPRAGLSKRWEFSATCSSKFLTDLVSALRNPPSTFDTALNTSVAYDMSSWCNTYFQETSYSTSSITYRAPTTTTIVTSTQTTTTRSQTSTVLCPAPSASAVCNTTGTLKESFISNHFLSTNETESGETCKQACLKVKTCSSFVLTEDKDKKVFERNYCTLYKAGLAGAFEGKGNAFDQAYYRFWDRSCAIYAAPGCFLAGSATVSAAPTPAPPPTPQPRIAKRDANIPIPEWLNNANFNWYPFINYGCSCLVTSTPMPILGGTRTQSIPQYDLTTITTTRTTVAVSVSVPVTSTYTYVAIRKEGSVEDGNERVT